MIECLVNIATDLIGWDCGQTNVPIEADEDGVVESMDGQERSRESFGDAVVQILRRVLLGTMLSVYASNEPNWKIYLKVLRQHSQPCLQSLIRLSVECFIKSLVTWPRAMDSPASKRHYVAPDCGYQSQVGHVSKRSRARVCLVVQDIDIEMRRVAGARRLKHVLQTRQPQESVLDIDDAKGTATESIVALLVH